MRRCAAPGPHCKAAQPSHERSLSMNARMACSAWLRSQGCCAGAAWRIATRCAGHHTRAPGVQEEHAGQPVEQQRQHQQQREQQDQQRPKEQVTVTFRGQPVRVRRGALLRTALLKAGLTPHNGDARLICCRGLGTCGTCAVEVRGQVAPAQRTRMEELRLNFPPHRPPVNQRLRLACQVRSEGDLHVTKLEGFWGQGPRPLPDIAGSAAAEGGGPGGGGAPPAAPEPRSVLGVGLTPLGALEFVLDPDVRSGGKEE